MAAFMQKVCSRLMHSILAFHNHSEIHIRNIASARNLPKMKTCPVIDKNSKGHSLLTKFTAATIEQNRLATNVGGIISVPKKGHGMRTMWYPNIYRRIKKHGLWKRVQEPGGRKIIMRRILKGRYKMGPVHYWGTLKPTDKHGNYFKKLR